MTDERVDLPANLVKIDFSRHLVGVKNLFEVENAIKAAIADVKQKGILRVGFVSGPIRTENASEDREKMRETVRKLSDIHRFPVFAFTDIFDVAWEDLEEARFPEAERSDAINGLFSSVLRSGAVTDVFMMEGWESARGCMVEKSAAEAAKIKPREINLSS